MEIKTLPIENATTENSKEYGKLITLDGSNADYEDSTFSFTRDLFVQEFSDTVTFSMTMTFSGNKITPLLEYHENTVEVLIPTDNDIVLIMALGKNKPEPATFKALKISCGDAFSFAPNIWHYAPLVVNDKSAKTFVVFNQSTPDKDKVCVDLLEEYGYVLGV